MKKEFIVPSLKVKRFERPVVTDNSTNVQAAAVELEGQVTTGTTVTILTI